MVKQGQEMNGIMHDAKDTINKKKVLKKKWAPGIQFQNVQNHFIVGLRKHLE